MPGWEDAPTEVDLKKWGALTAPVYGTSETGVYAGAELFAGPNKFGSYFAGVIPNGSIVKPAGTTVQVGMNPLGSVLTPDHKFLITTNDDEREGGFSSYQSTANVGGYSISVLDANSMKVVSTITTINGAAFKVFIGLAAASNGSKAIPCGPRAAPIAMSRSLVFQLRGSSARTRRPQNSHSSHYRPR